MKKSILEDTRIPRQVAFLANLSRDEDRNKSLVGLRMGRVDGRGVSRDN